MMKRTGKRLKLGNSPYLGEEHKVQKQHSSGLVFYKTKKLDKSIYSDQQTLQIIDYQAENIKLKQNIQMMRQQYGAKEKQLKKQLQSKKMLLEQKQTQIQQLLKKISKFQKEVSYKNQILKDKIFECQEIVKQIQYQQLKSSSHNMLQTSKIQKFNILEPTSAILVKPAQTHRFNPLSLQKTSTTNFQSTQSQNHLLQNKILLSNQSQDLRQNLANLNNVKIHQTDENSIFQKEKIKKNQRSVPKRAQSPGIVFNYTPQKIATTLTRVHFPQTNTPKFNTSLNHGKPQLNQNLPTHNDSFILSSHSHPVMPLCNNYSTNHSYANLQVINRYPNTIKRALSPQNIQMVNNPFNPLNYLPANDLIQQK